MSKYQNALDQMVLQFGLQSYKKVIKDGLGWRNIPKSVNDFNDNFLSERGHKRNSLLFFLFGLFMHGYCSRWYCSRAPKLGSVS
jgi:hypothetical protein